MFKINLILPEAFILDFEAQPKRRVIKIIRFQMFKINSIHLGVCMLDIETEFK